MPAHLQLKGGRGYSRGSAAPGAMAVGLLALLIMAAAFSVVFEHYMYLIRLQEARSAADIACWRIHAALSDEASAGASLALGEDYLMELEKELALRDGRILEASFSRNAIDGGPDDLAVHLVLAFRHEPSLLAKLIGGRELKVQIDRELAADR